MPEQIPNREKRSFRLDVRMETREADGSKIMRGHAAVFNEWADIGWFQERIAPGAFKDSIKEDDIRALFNHDANFVLGRNRAGTLSLSEDDKGLAVEIVPPDSQTIRDLVQIPMERGDISQMSFAFQTIEDEWEYGEEREPDRRTIKKVRLFDVSPVTYPAYEGTDIAVASRDRGKADKEAIESKAKAERLHTFKLRQKLYEKEDLA